MLPRGWYPESGKQAGEMIERWQGKTAPPRSGAIACVVPHAGWDFSGELAFSVLRCLAGRPETVVVIGGHLPPDGSLLMAPEEQFETPFGNIQADFRFAGEVTKRCSPTEDLQADNTVEIQLPLIRFLFPDAGIVHLRVSPSERAVELGRILADIASELNRKTVVVGSTDLTHYGPAYGFTPVGVGKEAVRWVREENDRPFLNHLLKIELKEALDHANANGSACSAGAGTAAMAFAKAKGVEAGELIGYRMSCDSHASDSFVGYGGVVYVP